MTSDDKKPPTVPDIAIRAAIELLPYGKDSMMTIYQGVRDRRLYRANQAMAEIEARVPQDQLQARLLESESLDALFGRAIAAAADSALEAKRRMLGVVIAEAVLDDALVDDSTLWVDLLAQVEVVHVRCLEDILRVQKEVEASGERPMASRGAEREINQKILDAGRKYPSPLLKTLANLSLLDAQTSWDRSTDYVHGLTLFGEEFLQHLRTAAGTEATKPVVTSD
ncbi:hypothetical protein GCM10009804_61290 [Kribbella hippodromi]|uniref:Uncharacterized protein n=1 Tax=Kribbella hippodromi TaxID=434347 RepID=A0ABN2E4T6_9ACTN